jgi:hypothetical protein
MSIDLKILRDNIEKFSQFHQQEILRLLVSENVILNENKNGTFINLSSIDDKIKKKIQDYVRYVKKQEFQLNELEDQKNLLTNTYFKGNKDNLLYNDI